MKRAFTICLYGALLLGILSACTDENNNGISANELKRTEASNVTVASTKNTETASEKEQLITNNATSSNSVSQSEEPSATVTSTKTTSSTPAEQTVFPKVIKNDWKYYDDDMHIEGWYYIGHDKKVTIPKGIGNNIEGLEGVEELFILSDVESFSPSECYDSLRSIIVSEKNKYLTSIEGVLYDKNVKEIVWYPYLKENKRYVIPESVMEISGERLPGGKYTEELVLHAKLNIIEYSNYGSPQNLKSVKVDKNNPYHSSIDGVLFNKRQTKLQLYPPKKAGSTYTVPETVTHICDWAFYYNWNYQAYSQPYLKTVVLPPNISYIANLGHDLYDSESPAIEVLQKIYNYLLFQAKENSITHQTLQKYGLRYKSI